MEEICSSLFRVPGSSFVFPVCVLSSKFLVKRSDLPVRS
jgi:hypothetical protein